MPKGNLVVKLSDMTGDLVRGRVEIELNRVSGSSGAGGENMIVKVNGPVGALTITSNPPANVVLDGRPLGKAPRIVKVPAGLHTVLFIHPLYGRKSLSVKVGAGATTSASAAF